MHVDAFILIGGKSTRLGRDKAFIELGGKTLVERAVHTLRKEFARVTIVTGNSLQSATRTVALGMPFIFDLWENRGPLGGLHAAVANSQAAWVFVLACDYPFVSQSLIRLLSDRISDEFGAVVPKQNDGRLQPLCAFYKVEPARSIFQDVLERPRPSPPLHEVVAGLKPLTIEFDEYSHLPGAADMFININTTQDLEHAEGKLSTAE